MLVRRRTNPVRVAVTAVFVAVFSFVGSVAVSAFLLPVEPAPKANIASPLNQLGWTQLKIGTIAAERFTEPTSDFSASPPLFYFDPDKKSVIEGWHDTSASEPNRVVSINASSTHITNVAYPQRGQDAANKQYVDDVLGTP